MKVLPTYSTIPEAVEWLLEQTKSKWSENELLDFAAHYQITLHAGAPISQRAGLYEIDYEGLRTKSNPKGVKQISSSGWGMAEIFPVHIAQILHVGETETIHAKGNPDIEKGELSLFSEPVKVTRDRLRISSTALHELLRKFRQSPRHNQTAVSTATSGAPAYRPKVGWQIALFDSWLQICKTYSRTPTAPEAANWLKKNDESGTILSKASGSGFWWKPQRGNAKEVPVKTIENVISAWRAKGVLPT